MDGEVDLRVGINITNVKDIANEIATTLSKIGIDTDKNPSSNLSKKKSNLYKSTFEELNIMKSVIKTINANFGSLMDDFEKLKVEITDDVVHVFDDLFSDKKKYQVNIKNIKEVTDDLVETLLKVVQNMRPVKVDTQKEMPSDKKSLQSVDNAMFASIINEIMNENFQKIKIVNDNYDILTTIHMMMSDFISELPHYTLTSDDIDRLITSVITRATRSQESVKESQISIKSVGEVTAVAENIYNQITQRLEKDVEGIKNFLSNDKLSIPEENLEQGEEILRTAYDTFNEIKEDINHILYDIIDENIPTDLSNIKIQDIYKHMDYILSKIDEEMKDKLIKFLASIKALYRFNVDDQSKINMTGNYLSNIGIKRSAEELRLANKGIKKYIPTPMNTEQLLREYMRKTFDDKFKESNLPEVFSKTQIDIASDVEKQLKELDVKFTNKKGLKKGLERIDEKTIDKIIAHTVKRINPMSLEVKTGKETMKPSNLINDLEKFVSHVAQGYFHYIIDEFKPEFEKGHETQMREELKLRIKELLYSDSFDGRHLENLIRRGGIMYISQSLADEKSITESIKSLTELPKNTNLNMFETITDKDKIGKFLKTVAEGKWKEGDLPFFSQVNMSDFVDAMAKINMEGNLIHNLYKNMQSERSKEVLDEKTRFNRERNYDKSELEELIEEQKLMISKINSNQRMVMDKMNEVMKQIKKLYGG